MPSYRLRFLSLIAVMLFGVIGLVGSPPADAAQSRLVMAASNKMFKTSSERVQLSPQEAAARAKAQHGGKVLKVTREGKGYRVRLLLDSGRVISVKIRG